MKAKAAFRYPLRKQKQQEAVHKIRGSKLVSLAKTGKGTPAEMLARKRNALLSSTTRTPLLVAFGTQCHARLRQHSITAHEACAAHKDALKLESEKLTSIHNALNPKIPAKGIEQTFI